MKKPRWSARGKKARPKLVIVGVGRTGGALAFRLKAAGWPVTVLPGSAASVKRAVALNLRLADQVDLAEAALCVLAVPDAAIAETALKLEADLGEHTALVHCAGALTLGAFAADHRPRGSFHPLVAISDARDALEGRWVAVAATDEKLKALLWGLALALRMHPFEVPEDRRAAYHAGAVMSAGLVVALLDAAVTATGLPRDAAEAALIALASSALAGASTRGLLASQTGPVVRGDVAVVERHLHALPPELGSLYRALSARALSLTEAKLPAEKVVALKKLL